VSTLAVALIPWYIANRDAVERSRSMLRIWAGGVRSLHGKYAELLARLGAEVRTYTTEVNGRKYERYLIVIKGSLYKDAVKALANWKRLRKLAKKNFNVLVEAFKYYSPRGLSGDEIRNKLRKLLGVRIAKRLLVTLRDVLRTRGRTPYTPDWKRTWLRELFRKDMKGYGFYKKRYACIKEFIEEGCDADMWTLKEVCRLKILGEPWADLLPPRCIYRF